MRFLACISLLLILGGMASAQTMLPAPGAGRMICCPRVGPQTMVRDSGGNLYVIYRYQLSTIAPNKRMAAGHRPQRKPGLNLEHDVAERF